MEEYWLVVVAGEEASNALKCTHSCKELFVPSKLHYNACRAGASRLELTGNETVWLAGLGQ